MTGHIGLRNERADMKQSMKSLGIAALLAAASVGMLTTHTHADDLEPSVTYQGVLKFQGQPVTDTREFRFALWDHPTTGQGNQHTPGRLDTVEVVGGLFQVELNWGSSLWDSTQLWLEIEIRDGNGDWIVVGDRQKITTAPYAVSLIGVQNQSSSISIGDGISVKDLFVRRGKVGIGTTNPQDELDVRGIIRSEGVRLIGGADIAEPFDVASDIEVLPGMVVAIDPETPGALELCTTQYNHRVAGIVSGANGINPAMTLSQEGTIADGEHPVALTGRVWCYVDADANGPITPGDMLTTSNTPGHAMRADDRSRAFGATIGKAMTTLEEGRGLVLVLVNLQ